MPSASAAAISRASASGIASWCRSDWPGLRPATPLSGLRRCAAISAFGRQRPARLGRSLDQHRLAAERGQRCAGTADSRDWRARRGRPARTAHRNARMKPAGRAGGHHDPRRDRGRRRKRPRNGARCARAAPGCRASRYSRCGRARARPARPRSRCRRGRRRLADLHVDDVPALRLALAPPPPSHPSR